MELFNTQSTVYFDAYCTAKFFMSPIPTAGQSFRNGFVAVNAMLISFTGDLVVSNCIALQVDLQLTLFAGIDSSVIQLVQLNSDNDVNIAIFSNLFQSCSTGNLVANLSSINNSGQLVVFYYYKTFLLFRTARAFL